MGGNVSSPSKAHRESTATGATKAAKKKQSVDKPAKNAPPQPLMPPPHGKPSFAAGANGDLTKLPPPQTDYRSNGHTANHSVDSHVPAPAGAATGGRGGTTSVGESDVQRHDSNFSYGYGSYLERLEHETVSNDAPARNNPFGSFHFPPLPPGQKSSSNDYYNNNNDNNTATTRGKSQTKADDRKNTSPKPANAPGAAGNREDNVSHSRQSSGLFTNFDNYASIFRENLSHSHAGGDSIDSGNNGGGSSTGGNGCNYSYFPESVRRRLGTGLGASVVPLQATDTATSRPRHSTRHSHTGLKSAKHSTTAKRNSNSRTLMASLFGRRSQDQRRSEAFMQSITNVAQSRSNSTQQAAQKEEAAAPAASPTRTDSLSNSAAELHRTMHLGERQWQRVRQSVVQLHEDIKEHFESTNHTRTRRAESHNLSINGSIVGPSATFASFHGAPDAPQQPRQSSVWGGGMSAVYAAMSRSDSSEGSARRRSSARDGSEDSETDGRNGRDVVRESSLMPSDAKQRRRRLLDGMGSISNWEAGATVTALRSSRVMDGSAYQLTSRGSYGRGSEAAASDEDDDGDEDGSASSGEGAREDGAPAAQEEEGEGEEEDPYARGRRRNTRAQRVVPGGGAGPCLRQGGGLPQAVFLQPQAPPPMRPAMGGPTAFRRFPAPLMPTPGVYRPLHGVPQPQPNIYGPPLPGKFRIDYERALNFSLDDIPWVKSPPWHELKVHKKSWKHFW